jgi:hypothetical protein
MSDKDFATQVSIARTTGMTEALDRDSKLDKLEDLLLDRMQDSVAYVTKPMELTRIFQTLNAAKRRSTPNTGELPQTQQIISLNIPVHVVANFQLSNTREIVEVDGRALVSMSAKQLRDQLDRRDDDANRLPQTTKEINSRAAARSIASKLT